MEAAEDGQKRQAGAQKGRDKQNAGAGEPFRFGLSRGCPSLADLQVLVGLVDGFELLAGNRIELASVGVKLLHELQVGGANLLQRGSGADAQHGVGVEVASRWPQAQASCQLRRLALFALWPRRRSHQSSGQERAFIAISPVDLRLRQVADLAQVGPAQSRLIEAGILEVSLHEARMAELGAGEIGPAQARVR